MNPTLPDFEHFSIEHILPNLETCIAQSRQTIDEITQQDAPTWDSCIAPLEVLDDALHQVWSPAAHYNAVRDSDALRDIFQQGVQIVTAWSSEQAQNEALFAAIRHVAERDDFATLSAEKRKVVENMLRDFRLSGAELTGDARNRFKTIKMRLSELGTDFEKHVLDATRAFQLHIEDESKLAGIPDSIRASAAQRARHDEKTGWLFTLDIPSYLPFMQYAENGELRQQMYQAYVTRASDGDTDNSNVSQEILQLRAEAAHLLGFETYADYSLATKMATSPDEAKGFLRELAQKTKPIAEQEVQALRSFAREHLHMDMLQAWDIPFVSEKLKQHCYNISQEDLKPYFPQHHVLQGLFQLSEKLYQIRIEHGHAPRWHDDVQFFDVFDASGACIAGFYLDPYARPHKRGGAWMDECVVRWHKPNDELQIPIAYLVCNFESPVGDQPALWTHEEVQTLFHEFGHGLHHMLSTIGERSISGINGVPWDAVELPSQFMENFCWEREAIGLFAKHVETGASLPDALFDKMIAAKNFQSGMQMLRQIEFALFDLDLHTADNPDIQAILDHVRQEVAVLIPPRFNRFQNSFSHIFAGGYAAGYYSYKWAEVLSADAFAAFEENGITDADTARRFRENILAVGGSKDFMDAFIAFRGRKPSVDALLRHSGIKVA